MRWIATLLFAVGLPAFAAAVQSPAIGPSKHRMFFLKDPMMVQVDRKTMAEGPEQQWCGYRSEEQFKSESEHLYSRITGNVEFTNSHVSAMHLWEGGEDHGTLEDYAFDERGTVLSMTRRLSVIPGEIDIEETWGVRAGKAVLRKRVVKRSGKEVGRLDDDIKDLIEGSTAVTSLEQFPFASFLSSQWKRVESDGKACEKAQPEVTVTEVPKPSPPVKTWKKYRDRFGWTVEYPATWTADSSCPKDCPGEAVSFTNTQDGQRRLLHFYVMISSIHDKPESISSKDWIDQIKHSKNVNPIISETNVMIGAQPALTVRYRHPQEEMESTYIVSERGTFEISISSRSGLRIEDLPDYAAYRQMLASFSFVK